MVTFRKMTEAEFCGFKESSVADYAEDLMQGRNISREQALKNAEAEFREMLLDGVETEDNYLMRIVDAGSGNDVGWIWFQFDEDDDGAEFVFLNDFLIYEAERLKGYATAALGEMNRLAKDNGCVRSELFVWAHNPGGISLYKKCGYESVEAEDGGTYMVKVL